MKIVIDISEKLYELLQRVARTKRGMENLSEYGELILNGTPLPKGHGSLKDFEKIYVDMKEKEELARQRVIDTPINGPCYMRYVTQLNERTAFKEMLYDAPTIIEADKGSEE